jgi:membrane fusion protein (multidrug efflux system)
MTYLHKTIRPYYFFMLLVIMFLFSGCKEDKDPASQAPPQIKVVEVIQQDIPIYNNFVGQVYGQEDVAINARVEGFLMSIHFDEGARIEKGKLLYSIDPEPFKAGVASSNSQVAEARTRLVNAENELARYKPLAEINAVSQSDLDFAQANRDASEAGLDAAKAQLRMAEINLGYTTVESPITGFIGKTQARVGDFVGRSPNPVILNVVSKIENVRVQFFITETQYLIIAREYVSRQDVLTMNDVSEQEQEESEGRAEVRLILSDGSMHPYPGILDFINREVDSETGAILVQASFPNPELILRPGQFARVRIMMNMAEGALLVPQRCVNELQGQYSAFVLDEQNAIQSRQIKIRAKHNDYYIVSEGLSLKDRVVLEGLQKVGSGMVVEPVLTTFTSQAVSE